jgi:hypothetical protein
VTWWLIETACVWTFTILPFGIEKWISGANTGPASGVRCGQWSCRAAWKRISVLLSEVLAYAFVDLLLGGTAHEVAILVKLFAFPTRHCQKDSKAGTAVTERKPTCFFSQLSLVLALLLMHY